MKIVNPLLSHPRGQLKGGLKIETGGLFERGVARLFNLAKTTVSALHKELENKVEKLKYKKLEFIQPGTKNKSELPVGE